MGNRVFVDFLNFSTPEIAGVGVFTRNLCGAWFRQNDLPYSITCYSIADLQPQDLFGFSESDAVRVKKVAVRRLIARLAYQQFIVPFLLRQYDLYYNPAVGLPFLARVISRRTKLVVTIHDMTPFYFPRKYTWFRSILVRILSKYAAKTAHHVITVSQNSKNDLIRIASLQSDKVDVVYNFIPPPYQLNNSHDHRYFLCISTLEPGKNIENTIRGYGKFRRESRFNDYEFNWIGRIGWGTSEQMVREMIAREELQDSFHLIGYVTEANKRKWLENCTAIVYLSYYEGFGLPVLEGLTFCKPSVASNSSSLPEVVGETGILCDPVDPAGIAAALERVILEREQLQKKIPDQLSRFDPARQISAFKKAIHSFLPEK